MLGVSVLDDVSLEAFREAVWRLTGLSRVFLRSAGEIEEEPVALHPPVTVLDVADSIHHELAARCVGARVWGPSARFEGQRVGRDTSWPTATRWRSWTSDRSTLCSAGDPAEALSTVEIPPSQPPAT